MDAISVLLIGDSRRDELRPAREFLAAATRLTSATSIMAAASSLTAGDVAPDVIVLAATWPGEFTSAQVDVLRQAAPLARLVSLVGSWSEGETRTGHPWPGVPRIYAHQFVPRFGVELQRLAHGDAPTWSLPVTATEDERLLACFDDDPVLRAPGKVVAIAARDVETVDALSDALRSRGYVASRTHGNDEGRRTKDEASAVIYDGRGGDAGEMAALRRFIERQTSPVIVLLDFPRAEDRWRAIEAGAGAVVSKPLLIDDLFWQIERLSQL